MSFSVKGSPSKIKWSSVQRILVIRHRFIGDTILLAPFLSALKSALPNHVEVDMMVAKGSGELLEGHPAVHQLLYYESSRQMLPILQARRYEVAFILKRSWSSAWLALQAQIPIRIGFDTEARGWMLTHPVAYKKGVHEAQAFMTTLDAVGLASHPPQAHPPQAKDWSFLTRANPLPPDLQNQINTFKTEGRHCVLWHAVASNSQKSLPESHWHAFWSELQNREKLPPLAFFTIGTTQEASYYQAFKTSNIPLINTCGRLTLPQSLHLVHQMNLTLGVDSGPLHMAGVSGQKVLSLFGPSAWERWHPLGAGVLPPIRLDLPCQPCELKVPCSFENRCLQGISPIDLVDRFLSAI